MQPRTMRKMLEKQKWIEEFNAGLSLPLFCLCFLKTRAFVSRILMFLPVILANLKDGRFDVNNGHIDHIDIILCLIR